MSYDLQGSNRGLLAVIVSYSTNCLIWLYLILFSDLLSNATVTDVK